MALFTNPTLIALMKDLKVGKEETEDVCNICTNANDLSTITLSCRHRFHDACFLKAISKQYYKKECPYCRSEVRLEDHKSTCQYTITRGPRKGVTCGRVCYSDARYCQTHAVQMIRKQQKQAAKSKSAKSKPVAAAITSAAN